MRWLTTALLVYFGLRLLFFALKISSSVPPDEVTHFAVSRIFSKVFLLPENSPETYQYGLVTTIPWLYYWIMGKLLHLNFFGIHDLVFLRLCNIPFAFGTVYFAWRTLRLLTDDRLTQLLLIIAMTNTVMFSFLSASVSYDNLTNLLAAMSIYYLLAFFCNRSGTLLAASFLCQLVGCLMKPTFLPLVLVLMVILLANEFKKLRLLPSALSSWFRPSGRYSLCLTFGIVIGLVFNLQLYGGNIFNYRNLTPDMEVVLSPEIAMKYRTQARNMIFTMFKEGKVTKKKALEMTTIISHKGDRDNTVGLIEDFDFQIKSGEPVISPLEYIPIWVETMCAGVFGVFAHLPMPITEFKIFLVIGLMGLAGLAFLIRWRPRETGWLPAYLGVIAAFYAIFLMYVVNYRTYLDYRSIWLSLQGRYIFPVIGPIYVLSSCYLMRLFSGRSWRLAVFVAVALFFIISDFPFFLSSVTSNWFIWPSG
ncbi:MAG: hypothetical protein JJE30_14805 [Desulfuromonadales bacterium]|nr:hypothetical protein [Desulfuromonadales bacterium]